MARVKKSAEETGVEEAQGEAQASYEKWKVEPKALGGGVFELTAISLKLDNVRIGEETADLLNEQAHNSKIYYFAKGTVSNGTTIKITTNKKTHAK